MLLFFNSLASFMIDTGTRKYWKLTDTVELQIPAAYLKKY